MAQTKEQRAWTDEDLAALFDRFFAPLYDVAARVLGSEDDAGSAIARAFSRARAELRRRTVDDVGPWLYGLLVAELPKRRPPGLAGLDGFAQIDADRLANPSALTGRQDAVDAVWSALSALPVEDYLLLDLQVRHGLRDRELAAAVRLDGREVERRLERLRAQLEDAVVSPISPIGVFAALAPVTVPADLQEARWATTRESPEPASSRTTPRIGWPRKPILAAAGLALFAAAITVGAFFVARGGDQRDAISVQSTSHRIDQGSPNPDIAVAWTPSADARGYSVSWSSEPETPDTTVDIPGAASRATGHVRPGTTWFNLRTLRANGDWTNAVHLGPFLILPDTVVPETTISEGPRRLGTPEATFEFASNEPGARLECSLDGKVFNRCTSPTTYSKLDRGRHTFRVRAIDDGGNTDPTPARRNWVVDDKPPKTELTASPDDFAQGDARFEFSSERHSSFECKLDDAKFAPCSSPKTYRGLKDGSHRFRLRAIDKAGNPDPTPVTRKWVVDTKAPETTVESGPPHVSHKPTATFSLSSEAGVTFECSLDGHAWGACGALSGLEDGKHALRARATDRAGNVDPSPAKWSWKIDLPPETTINTGPSGPTSSKSATFRFSSADNAATFECRLDGGNWGACSSPKAYSSLSQGEHTFRVRAKEAGGTHDPSAAIRTWTVDTVAPNTTITSGPNASTGANSASFSFSSSESGVGFQCRLDGGSWRACNSPKSYSGLKKGSHVFRVRAVDDARNADASPDAWSWTIH